MKKLLCLLSLCFASFTMVGCGGDAETDAETPETPAAETTEAEGGDAEGEGETEE